MFQRQRVQNVVAQGTGTGERPRFVGAHLARKADRIRREYRRQPLFHRLPVHDKLGDCGGRRNGGTASGGRRVGGVLGPRRSHGPAAPGSQDPHHLARAPGARAQGKPDRLVFVGDNGPWHWCLLKEVAPAFEKASGIKLDFTLLPIDATWPTPELQLRSGISAVLLGQRTAKQARDIVAADWQRSLRRAGIKPG